MSVSLREQSFLPYEELLSFQKKLEQAGKYGATVSFVGTMRDFNCGDQVTGMMLEHYQGMTEKQLEQIVETAQNRWPLVAALVIHRVGRVNPDEPIVLIAVWSAHRAEAFEASRFIIEELKTKAPFWKKETLTEGERWVEAHSS